MSDDGFVDWETIKETPAYPNKGDMVVFVKANKPREDPERKGCYLIRSKDDRLFSLWATQLQPIARAFTESKAIEIAVTFMGYTAANGKEYVKPVIGTATMPKAK